MNFFQSNAFVSVAAKVTPSSTRPVDECLPKFHDSPATAYHLRSMVALVLSLAERRLIPPFLLPVLLWFVSYHDRGYGKFAGGMIDVLYLKANERMYRGALRQTVGDDTDEAFAYALNALADTNFLAMHTAGRVVTHAVLGLPFAVQALVKAGAKFEAAVAAGKLMASHHFGFPLEPMVTGFAAGLGHPLTPTLKRAFMIGTESRRLQIALECGGLLGLSSQEAKELAAWFFMVDRLTSMRRMRGVRLTETGWTATDGESFKKLGFAPGNLKDQLTKEGAANLTVEGAFAMAESVMEREGFAAKDCCEAMQAHDVLAAYEALATYEMSELRSIHSAALRALKRLRLTGCFADINADLPVVEKAHFANPDDDTLAYLAGAMRVMAPDIRKLFPA